MKKYFLWIIFLKLYLLYRAINYEKIFFVNYICCIKTWITKNIFSWYSYMLAILAAQSLTLCAPWPGICTLDPLHSSQCLKSGKHFLLTHAIWCIRVKWLKCFNKLWFSKYKLCLDTTNIFFIIMFLATKIVD